MIKLILFIIVFMATSSITTYLLYRTTNNRWIKYIPSIILLGVIVYVITLLIFSLNNESIKDLATFIIIVLFIPSLVSTVGTGLFLDYKINKRLKKQNDKSNSQ